MTDLRDEFRGAMRPISGWKAVTESIVALKLRTLGTSPAVTRAGANGRPSCRIVRAGTETNSLGMNDLSRLAGDTGKSVPRKIALCKDPIHGSVAIDLPPKKEAAILTIRNTELREWTADGRPNDDKLGTPTFGGVVFIKR